ncbi:H-NS histone family protein [Paraburkholderia caledonica]|uniref:H-NS histone family protein n=1 Tax=Paraburkholderia caledonica TaxID=134536 RepID=UPI0015C633F6|nr:H-NS histone family protein [Paraburkholderia caledonica]
MNGGIRLVDLQDARSRRRYEPIKSGRYVPKYRDADSGATWSGRGREPFWIAGKDRKPFVLLQTNVDDTIGPK